MNYLIHTFFNNIGLFTQENLGNSVNFLILLDYIYPTQLKAIKQPISKSVASTWLPESKYSLGPE